ncbi:phosphoribosyltransferase family protein [Reyranella sp.]|uniref:phosphoribosyltransferase family protein n=1 Tax=Reyranella sp. TaxID=1929291 RepID=UPI002719608F|nr:phosphoribosyltransferase family protein [Reyranella sp.]MDO8977548.1 hypothetical protein [Reyranella sp.]
MALTVYAWGAYATYNHRQIAYRDEDSQVYVMVQVAKGELTSRQFSYVTALDGTRLRVSKDNPAAVHEIFGQYGACTLRLCRNSLIVPVPSSSHTVLGTPFTGSKLVDAIVKKLSPMANMQASPILAFDQVMPRASKGEANGRDKTFIQSHLITKANSLQGINVILVDDVCTSGAHLLACADYLRAKGATVANAVCIGKTSPTQHPTPLAVKPEDIENPFSMFFQQ